LLLKNEKNINSDVWDSPAVNVSAVTRLFFKKRFSRVLATVRISNSNRVLAIFAKSFVTRSVSRLKMGQYVGVGRWLVVFTVFS